MEEDKTVEGKLVVRKVNVTMPCPFCQVMVPCEIVYCTDEDCGGHGRIDSKKHNCIGIQNCLNESTI